MTEDDDGNIDGTEHGQFMCLFEETAFSLQERTIIEHSQSASSTSPVARHQTHTERLRSSLIALISIFLRPIAKITGVSPDPIGEVR